MFCPLQGHVCFRVSRGCSVLDRWSDEGAQSLRDHRQRGAMVTQERRQLAQLRSFTSSFSMPLRRESAGVPLRAGGLDPTGMEACLRRKCAWVLY